MVSRQIKAGFAAWVCLGFALSSAHAQTAITRVEAHPIVTKTLSQDQFLRGETDGQPTTISGMLRIPAPYISTQKIPAVVLMPGLGGIASLVHEKWAEEINAIGSAVLIVDSFAARNLYVIPEHARLSSLTRMVDAFAALQLLSKHPRIDPSRIAIMGISGGAIAALYSSNERFRKNHASEGATFAAHVAITPPCHMTLRDDTKTTGKPIRIYHGTADDWNPIGPCRQYVERLKQAGQDVVLTELQDAQHSFEWPIFQQPTKFPQATTARNCQLEERENGALFNAKSGAAFDMNDPCLEKGTTVAYNAAATQQTAASMRVFLIETFGLKRPESSR